MKALFCLVVAVCLLVKVLSYPVEFDGRSFIINGKRELLIGGSIHYPRAPRSEWHTILSEARESGINLIQTYVFWDVHEPANNEWYFPTDKDSNLDLVAFVKLAGSLGMYVNLRISGYVCAEWNHGGLPIWLRENNGTIFRTYDAVWMMELAQFFDKTVAVVNDAGLLAADGGPIVMMQMENEYGNMEDYYGEQGHDYVAWAANYALQINQNIKKDIVWIMCQQGEGVGTAPIAQVINTCNGYYCDNWITQHASAFPNQPHMFTENWPGWFQNWGQPIPHRPAVDVAFSVARWFARGGSYMNYYMAYGGTNYGRTVGGPLIITSYDYDVHINEFAQRNEPKFTLLQRLHSILGENAQILLGSKVPTAVMVAKNCEAHTYVADGKCILFVGNWDETNGCSFQSEASSFDVPAWSVSILSGEFDGASCLSTESTVFNTKEFAISIKSNRLVANEVNGFFFEKGFEVYSEPIPSSADNESIVPVFADSPREQLSLTKDKTDYLWYSVSLNVSGLRTQSPGSTQTVELSMNVGNAGGGLLYAFVNGDLQASTTDNSLTIPHKLALKSAASGTKLRDVTFSTPVTVSITIPSDADVVAVDLLSVSMGIQNYGPYIEKFAVGIVSDITAHIGSTKLVLRPVKHSVGLLGESKQLDSWSADSQSCDKLCWYRSSFATPKNLTSSQLALDLSSMSKGFISVNGHMLGRFWSILAQKTALQTCDISACTSKEYTGAYSGDICRTGCGDYSQRYYKLPREWLFPASSGKQNTIVLFDELGGQPKDIKLVTMAMESD